MKPIDNIFYWQYPAGTIPDALIEHTFNKAKTKERMDGRIGDGSVNKDIRSVERTPLDEFDPISVFLYGLAVKSNEIILDLIWEVHANLKCSIMITKETIMIVILIP